ncbi:hypothetical protein QEJ31_06110 [Pigmentibacter sp. JX0631]|uniref:hypothetical protein n=1 Tax=Pigmentibacter sp. JX0631 TaxID=2976982 RepID=UPI00246979D8|nr:hypothetical protein [Pigmentibacter sp. JX0631]WGL61169.1 hypothetical protein QEJ31_06110 [Pigmentibacter sp. JX0631]
MKKIILIFVINFFTISNVFSKNLLVCEYDELYKTGCHIEEFIIGENLKYQMDFSTNYKFDCEGHDFQVGISTEFGFYPMQRSTKIQKILSTFQARAALKVLNPDKLYAKILNKNCELTILQSEQTPSLQTITMWNDDAKNMIKTLRTFSESFQLAKNLLEINNWDKNKLSLFYDQIKKISNLYPQNLQLKLLLSSIESVLQNRPELIQVDQATKENLINYYKNKILEIINEANKLIEIVDYWKIKLDADLKIIIDELKLKINNSLEKL